jgi:hypothetical protein
MARHNARSPQQAIAIGLSKARRAGVKLAPPKGPSSLRKKAEQDAEASRKRTGRAKTSPKRSRAVEDALKKEPKSTTGHQALSRQAKKSAATRGRQNRRQASRKAARVRKAA